MQPRSAPSTRPPVPSRLPNLRKTAVDVVRAAEHLHRSTNAGPVAVAQATQALHRAAVRAMHRGGSDRNRLVATLALIAADFAVELPQAARDRIYARLDLPDDALAALAAGMLLTDPTGVQRPLMTGKQPVADPAGSAQNTGRPSPPSEGRATDVPDGDADDRSR